MLEIIVPGPPIRKNDRHKVIRIAGRGTMKNSDRFNALVEALAVAATKQRHETICEGEWKLSVYAYWPTLRHLDTHLPNGDHDAPLSCISDALEKAGVIDNDARIVRSFCEKFYDPKLPRTVIRLEQIWR